MLLTSGSLPPAELWPSYQSGRTSQKKITVKMHISFPISMKAFLKCRNSVVLYMWDEQQIQAACSPKVLLKKINQMSEHHLPEQHNYTLALIS